MSKERILITTGIYPPKIGGPAQYAKNLARVFLEDNHQVSVKTFSLENYLPTGFRHLFFFLKILPSVSGSDLIIALDTFSVGFPSVLAAKILGRKIIVRTGGDFLWEGYVERTGKKILFKNFYQTELANLSFKEKLIFKITRWTLKHASKVIFSTEWQRDIFMPAYGLDSEKTAVIENYYGPKETPSPPYWDKTFIGSTRHLKWKNLDTLEKVFARVGDRAKLVTENYKFEELMARIKTSYAVILVSLGDISPNLILDAIRLEKPFIATKENGLMGRIRDVGLFVDPLDEEDITKAIEKMLDGKEYQALLERLKNFNFTHTWEEIANEFLEISQTLK